jgi:phage shock protein C
MDRHLYKSQTNKVIAGVCGGIAEYFDVDPIIVRVIFVLLFFAGPGFWIYLILWIIVPRKPEALSDIVKEDLGKPKMATKVEEKINQNRRNFGGGVLVLIGFLLLIDNIAPKVFSGSVLAILLIGAGLVILYNGYKNN